MRQGSLEPAKGENSQGESQESGLKEGDYLLIRASKVKRFHLLDWDEMRDVYEVFPEEIRREVDGLKRKWVPHVVTSLKSIRSLSFIRRIMF